MVEYYGIFYVFKYSELLYMVYELKSYYIQEF